MEDKSMYSRKATLSLKISEFEVPPMQDLLIIGKKKRQSVQKPSGECQRRSPPDNLPCLRLIIPK